MQACCVNTRQYNLQRVCLAQFTLESLDPAKGLQHEAYRKFFLAKPLVATIDTQHNGEISYLNLPSAALQALECTSHAGFLLALQQVKWQE